MNPALKQSILAILQERIVQAVPSEKIEQMTIVELGVDSMTLLQLSFDLETDFNLKINLDTLSSSTTVADLINNLESMDD
jgi:acyl carrier protein